MTEMAMSNRRERPILFSGRLVRAILREQNPKTQTRRVIRPQPNPTTDPREWIAHLGPSPYGVEGDRLWVRETFCPIDNTEFGGDKYVEYRADTNASHPGGWDNAPDDAEALKWRPSIHMPRKHSRIDLEVTRVQVERLQDISTDDIIAEGVEVPDVDYTVRERPDVLEWERDGYARSTFRDLWDHINAKRGYSWESNPFVWVVEFRRIDKAGGRPREC